MKVILSIIIIIFFIPNFGFSQSLTNEEPDINSWIVHKGDTVHWGELMYEMCLRYYNDTNDVSGKYLFKAFKCFKEYADKGHAGSQYTLGFMYWNGEGCLTDKNKAIEYFMASAKQNCPDAQYRMGLLYYFGENIELDKSKSAYWMRKAYENDFIEAKTVWDDLELWKYEKD